MDRIKYKVGKYYMTEFGICRYEGIIDNIDDEGIDGKCHFRFKDLDWYIRKDSDQTIMQSEFKVITKYMTQKEMEDWVSLWS